MSSIEFQPKYVEVAAAATTYVEISADGGGLHAVQIAWPDATSDAAITLETSNWPRGDVAATSTNAMHWYDESTAPDGPVTIVGPAGSAAGNTMVHMDSVGCKRARLKIVATATTKLWILPSGKM